MAWPGAALASVCLDISPRWPDADAVDTATAVPGEVDVVAMYEVRDGMIAKAWFRMGVRRLHGART